MTVSLASAAEVALGRQRAPQHEGGPHQVRYLRSANIGDGVLDLSDVKAMNFTPSEQQLFGLQPGDVLLTEGSGSRDTVGASAVWMRELGETVCYQNTLLRLRPRRGKTTGRYLAWWARHAHASGMFAAAASGANILHLGAETLRSMQLHLPSLEEQRRIADFLDDQVTRIDAAVAARSCQLDLIADWLAAYLDELLVQSVTQDVRLLLLTDPARPVQYGIVLPGPDFPGGVPIVKGGDVAAQRMHPDLLQRTSPEIDATCPRSRLVEGDLLMAIRGSVGELATVPASLSGANITQDAARIAPHSADPEWLRWILQTPTVQGRVRRQVTGATVRGINIGELRRLMIPTPDTAHQASLGREAARSADLVASTRSALENGIGLLQERKRALITAAVTGEFDVSSAGPRAAAAVTG